LTYGRDEISAEYDASALETEEFAKVKWGSAEGMLRRFELAMELLPFSDSTSWLDVGCGTGAFQEMVLRKFPNISGLGIDLSPRLCRFSEQRCQGSGLRFQLCDFMDLEGRLFDLITAIGVLQKTTFGPNEFFQHAAALLNLGGRLFLSTKNIGWNKFKEPGFIPEQTHKWFSAEELRKSCEAAGMRISRMDGFLPREGRIVPTDESHDLFLVAEKFIAD